MQLSVVSKRSTRRQKTHNKAVTVFDGDYFTSNSHQFILKLYQPKKNLKKKQGWRDGDDYVMYSTRLEQNIKTSRYDMYVTRVKVHQFAYPKWRPNQNVSGAMSSSKVTIWPKKTS